MCKVMLVDDEKFILEGVSKIIDWGSMGAEIVHLANNGQDALEKYKAQSVDIIVTDISMPKLNGIELIRSIKEISDATKFIILSGYDDFSFAKEAISLGIENYILKPINEVELESTIKNVIEKIRLEKKTFIFEKQNIETLKNNIYSRLLINNINKSELEERGFMLNLSLDKAFYHSAIIRISEEDNTEENRTILLDYIGDICAEGQGDIFVDNKRNMVFLKGWAYEVDQEVVMEYYEELLKNLKNKLGMKVFISLGAMVKGYNNIGKSFEEAEGLSKYLLVNGYNNIITKDSIDLKLERNKISVDLINLRKLIIEKKKPQVREEIINIFTDIRNNSPEEIYDLSIKIIVMIDETGEEFKIWSMKEYSTLRTMIIRVCNEETLEGLREHLIKEAQELIDKLNSSNCKYTPVVQQIITYINENSAQDMNLKTLAQKFNMNTSYLGQMFSNEVGMSFAVYLNKCKNEKAKDLLLNTSMKINDISKIVGYSDASYFYRKFKKYYGVCPADLRATKQY